MGNEKRILTCVYCGMEYPQDTPATNKKDIKRPEWWPECPWPEEVWPMTQKEYVVAVPDPKLRTAINGFLMRLGWELCEKEIWKRLKNGSSIHEKLKDILLSGE